MATGPGFLLHDVARQLRKRFEQRAKCLGLTRSQWQTLAHLSNNEGIHQAGLAEILEIEPITLVRILDKLEERGLVERRRHPKGLCIWHARARGTEPITRRQNIVTSDVKFQPLILIQPSCWVVGIGRGV